MPVSGKYVVRGKTKLADTRPYLRENSLSSRRSLLGQTCLELDFQLFKSLIRVHFVTL
ncbi:hypothetical protein X946_3312 [Burkholderia sp. ABCPW 111]|nr:hypothetical protein X946_3312 [Burkholderia sp. ABCPW 111]